uniref:Familial acute myelogenous leukemia related factor n=1 Tax=Homo sapiens TaxID=9606 RepID=A3FMQ3_HUMAN|nr:familial acute myelogenous leukemia related factor [Homo sapiens]
MCCALWVSGIFVDEVICGMNFDRSRITNKMINVGTCLPCIIFTMILRISMYNLSLFLFFIRINRISELVESIETVYTTLIFR